MNKISDFNSILEIAFGINLLFYFFEVIPRFEERLKFLGEKNHQLVTEKIRVTKNSEVFPTGFVVGAMHAEVKTLFTAFSILTSIVVLGLMLYGSFYPEAQMKTFWVWVLLTPAFGVPSVAFFLHSRNERFACAANEHLAQEIRRATTSE